jgi:hypothetical protein
MPRIESPRGALAGAVRALVAAVEDEGVISDWEFAADAPARVDWVANEQASGWGDRPLQDAYRTGAILWYVVADQALSVADLLDSGRGRWVALGESLTGRVGRPGGHAPAYRD